MFNQNRVKTLVNSDLSRICLIKSNLGEYSKNDLRAAFAPESALQPLAQRVHVARPQPRLRQVEAAARASAAAAAGRRGRSGGRPEVPAQRRLGLLYFVRR